MRVRAVVPIALCLLLGSCGGDGAGSDTDGPGSDGISQAAADEAVDALCELGTSGSVAEAREAFFARAHETLHHVADRVTEIDPAVAAALLEAKFAVESALEQDAPSPDLPERAGALVQVLRSALDALGLNARACAS